MPIDNDRRVREPVDFQRTAVSGLSPAASQAQRRPSPDSAQRAVEALPDAPAYADFLRNVGVALATGARAAAGEGVAPVQMAKADLETQSRLDDFRARFSGPYAVDGKSVQARPMFRMNTGFNDAQMHAHQNELLALCKKAGCANAAVPACYGRPTPEQLVKVTQVLIDAGKLGPGSDASLELRIRQMQWEWGVGVDCAGYTEGAAAAARGGKSVQPSMNDAFSSLTHDPSKRKVPVGGIRAGDVIHLNPPKGERVGHNVVVYDSKLADSATRAQLSARSPEAAAFLRGAGPFQVLLVDSSWGAGEGHDFGGFRRDTWIHDTSTDSWGYFDHGSGSFGTSTIGPHDEPYGGAFRAKGVS
ncbi:MAG: hypothetical protein JWM74_607 [Myxococcaceae bacterium]|jgi:hypothetical protein|nr:hypothetical protein [Myxococcaceae bacterium]